VRGGSRARGPLLRCAGLCCAARCWRCRPASSSIPLAHAAAVVCTRPSSLAYLTTLRRTMQQRRTMRRRGAAPRRCEIVGRTARGRAFLIWAVFLYMGRTA
jgi:hypothetical protein